MRNPKFFNLFRRSRHQSVAPVPFKLQLEELEPRLLLSGTTLVTTTADSGPGSLRDAINVSNAMPGRQVIRFSISSGQQTIKTLSMLPAIIDATTIDGSSQPGFAGSPLIEIDGSDAGPQTSGLRVVAENTEIRSLSIHSFKRDGIRLVKSGKHRIKGNYIGVDASGIAALGNGGNGIGIHRSSGNKIGGASGNLISANAKNGILIAGSASTLNRVQNNLVGTDASATSTLGSSLSGIFIKGGSTANRIGGGGLKAGNVISLDGTSGIHIKGHKTSGNSVHGNLIGTDTTGAAIIGDSDHGILVDSSPRNIIGRLRGNVIAGMKTGIMLTKRSAQGNVLENNSIGVSADSSTALGNTGDGIQIADARNNRIGSPRKPNEIAFNSGNGVRVNDATGNTIRGNSIHSNDGLGIDVGSAGVSRSQLAFDSAEMVRLTDLRFGDRSRIDFYASPRLDASGFGEGKIYLGSLKTRHEAIAPLDALPTNTYLTALVTDAEGTTYEFSSVFDGPIARDRAFSTGKIGTLSEDVIVTATDYNGNNRFVSMLNGETANVGQTLSLDSGALISLQRNGEFTYDTNRAFDSLQLGDAATDQITYEISDGKGFFSTATISIEIRTAFASAREIPSNVTNRFDRFADIDGDGDLDTIFAGFGKVGWNENTDGKGTFSSNNHIATIPDRGPESLDVVDLNGDELPDILLTTDSDVYWLENLGGTGNFGKPSLITSRNGDPQIRIVATSADIDVDGDLDVFVQAGGEIPVTDDDSVYGKLSWFENVDGKGNFGAEQEVATFVDSLTRPLVDDIDGDGDSDYIVAVDGFNRVEGGFFWLQNNGQDGFVKKTIDVDVDLFGITLVKLDYDADGDIDLILQDDFEAVLYKNLNGKGRFGPATEFLPDDSFFFEVVPFDFDGDGDEDLLFQHEDSSGFDFETVSDVFVNIDGKGISDTPIRVKGLESAFGITVADLDGDGDDDLIASAQGINIAWYETIAID